jgi:EcsC protein family
MARNTGIKRAKLTEYESDQVQQIAAWKSEPPNVLAEVWKTLTWPGATAIAKLVPERLVEVLLNGADAAAGYLTWQEELKRQAGVSDIAELRDRPLEECDRMALRTGLAAQVVAMAEGAATGAGGVWTTLLDVPLLFILALRTIRKIGCEYGYHLEKPKDRRFVLGVLLVALSGSLHIRRQRLQQLRELEELLIEETVEDIVVEEILSFIFQLEVFEELPGVGAISGALLNLGFMHRVDTAARRIFQERWLRDNGKVQVIQPAEAHPTALVPGLSGVLGRAVYAGSYLIGFGVALPACIVALAFQSMSGGLGRGLRDGGTAAANGAVQMTSRGRAARPATRNGRSRAALAGA